MTGVILTPRKAGLHIAKPHVHSDHWYNKGDRCKPQIYGRKGNFEGWDCGNTIRKLSSPQSYGGKFEVLHPKSVQPKVIPSDPKDPSKISVNVWLMFMSPSIVPSTRLRQTKVV